MTPMATELGSCGDETTLTHRAPLAYIPTGSFGRPAPSADRRPLPTGA